MGIGEIIVLGLIQGLTEFIPVSSSGHLVIAQVFFSGASEHYFLEWIDLGTFFALIVYFRQQIADIILDVTVRRKFRLGVNILIAAIPAGLVGMALGSFIEKSPFFGSIITVTVTLGLVGIVMVVTDKLPQLSHVKNGERLSWKRAFIIGLIQILALIPGVSRSGSTIIAGRLMGLDGAAAARFSFLVSLPIMFGLILKLVISSDGRQYFIAHAPTLIVGNIVAFISGLVAVSFLMNYLSNHSLSLFGWYRIGLATVLTAVVLVQLVSN